MFQPSPIVRSPDFARQPRLPKGKKVKGKKVKSSYLQCAMLFPGYFCKRAKEASTARTLSLNIDYLLHIFIDEDRETVQYGHTFIWLHILRQLIAEYR